WLESICAVCACCPRRGADRGLGCADLLLCADGRRPGVLATDLLHPRADRADRLRLLRLGCVEGATPPLEERTGRRPRELRRDPPGRHLWRADAAYRL